MPAAIIAKCKTAFVFYGGKKNRKIIVHHHYTHRTPGVSQIIERTTPQNSPALRRPWKSAVEESPVSGGNKTGAEKTRAKQPNGT